MTRAEAVAVLGATAARDCRWRRGCQKRFAGAGGRGTCALLFLLRDFEKMPHSSNWLIIIMM